MAKLTKLPEQAIIDGFKGVIDFYIHMGIPCARSWPRSPGRHRAPAVMAQWDSFTFATQEWHNISPELQQAYNRMASNSGWSGRDLMMKAYLGTLFTYPTP